ncbi:hypothetical protein [Streptomyces sp. NPDC088184]|uniref:hypothetical protein n=1 Tax=Streptomyces sp. NPDC088184 TaxID=3160991 RepID=UPI003438A2C9
MSLETSGPEAAGSVPPSQPCSATRALLRPSAVRASAQSGPDRANGLVGGADETRSVVVR